HQLQQHVRTSHAPVHGQGPHRLSAARPRDRLEQARSRGRSCRPPAASAGADDRDDRRPARRGARRQGRGGDRRSHPLVHDRARHSQARQPVRYLRHARHFPLASVQPVRDHDAHLRPRPQRLAAVAFLVEWNVQGVASRAGWETSLLVLTQFIFQLTFGMSAAMLCAPPSIVTSGYYRNNLYAVLGLCVLAALVAMSDANDLLRATPAIACAVLAYMGSVAWL